VKGRGTGEVKGGRKEEGKGREREEGVGAVGSDSRMLARHPSGFCEEEEVRGTGVRVCKQCYCLSTVQVVCVLYCCACFARKR